jgi:hypothetical protein
MAKRLADCLRATRRNGLTSPNPVRTPTPARALRPRPRQGTPDKPQNRQRHGKHVQKLLAETNANPLISRWIEAKATRAGAADLTPLLSAVTVTKLVTRAPNQDEKAQWTVATSRMIVVLGVPNKGSTHGYHGELRIFLLLAVPGDYTTRDQPSCMLIHLSFPILGRSSIRAYL